MIRRSIFVLALAVLVAGLALAFALGPRRASAHGEPEITIRPASAAAGGTITIEGEGFEEGSEVRLTLVAASGRSDLGTVIADEEGAFHFEASLPQSLTAGSLEVHAESGRTALWLALPSPAPPPQKLTTLSPPRSAWGVSRRPTAMSF